MAFHPDQDADFIVHREPEAFSYHPRCLIFMEF
jgi:hypothetical protein